MSTLYVPFPLLTIGLAQAVALPGDTIQLGGGYAGEKVLLVKSGLTIRGDASNVGIEVTLGQVVDVLNLAGTAPINVIGSAAGFETIRGNAGDNRITILSNATAATTGPDVVSGGGGVDTLVIDYSAATEAVAMMGPTITAGEAAGFVSLGGVRKLTFSEIDLLSVTGGTGADLLWGGAGVDRIDGGAGADVLYGGFGSDVMYGGTDSDVLYGNQDADTLYGDDAADRLFGGQGDDALYGGLGDDLLEGGIGANIIQGGDGSDTVSYANVPAAVTASLALQGTSQHTGVSVDLILGVENLTGSPFNDQLTGSAGDNVLDGGFGADVVYGGFGRDTLIGGAGADALYGNQGDDTLRGGDDDDGLYGGQGEDLLEGGDGADLLQGGLLSDTLTGGAGADVFRLVLAADSAPAAPDLVTDFQTGWDTLDLRAIRTGAMDTFTLTSQGGGVTSLSVDLGGDGVIDTVVLVTGAITTADVLWG